MWLICVLTVFSLINNFDAIALLLRPWYKCSAISNSLLVKLLDRDFKDLSSFPPSLFLVTWSIKNAHSKTTSHLLQQNQNKV